MAIFMPDGAVRLNDGTILLSFSQVTVGQFKELCDLFCPQILRFTGRGSRGGGSQGPQGAPGAQGPQGDPGGAA